MRPILLLALATALPLLTACGGDRAEEPAVSAEAMSPSIEGDEIPPPQTAPQVEAEAAAARAGVGADESALEISTQGGPGPYLVDSRGHALYALEGDTDGSACTGECLEAWPPLLRTELPEAGQGLDAGMIGTMTRADNTLQVTYGGMPLYYYAQDADAGPPTGHDVHDQWGGWYLVGPDGKRLEGG